MKHIKNIEVGDIVCAPNGINRQKDFGPSLTNDPPGTEYEVLAICYDEELETDLTYGDVLVVSPYAGNSLDLMSFEEALTMMGNKEGAKLLMRLKSEGIKHWLCAYSDLEKKYNEEERDGLQYL